MSYTNFVCTDIGASCTRYANSAGKFGVIPNNVNFVEKFENGKAIADLTPVQCNVDSTSIMDNLELIIEHPDELIDTSDIPVDKLFTKPNFPLHVMIGSMAYSNAGINVTPKINEYKTGQLVNYVSLISAIALSRLSDNIGENLTLYLALPPVEARYRQQVLSRMYAGDYTVKFVRLGQNCEVNFHIDNVECFPESSAAIMSFLINLDGTPNSNYQKYGNKRIMSVDIGASTTDIVIMESGAILEKTGKTYKVGGNVVAEKVKDQLMALFPDVRESDAFDAVAEGRVHVGGSDYRVVGNLVDGAKRDVARQIAGEMDRYFSDIGMSMRDIDAIIVSGGGSMSSRYIGPNNEIKVTSAPMSDFLTEVLTEKYPAIEVVNHGDNPRMANTCGLYVRARVREAVEKKKAAQTQEQQETSAQNSTAQSQASVPNI